MLAIPVPKPSEIYKWFSFMHFGRGLNYQSTRCAVDFCSRWPKSYSDMATADQKKAPRGLEVEIKFIGPGSPSVPLRNGWGREWTATAPTQPEERFTKEIHPQAADMPIRGANSDVVHVQQVYFLVPESPHTWLCKSLQFDLASTVPHWLQSIFSDGLYSSTGESRVPAPVSRHGLAGPARAAGTKKY